MRLAIAGAVCLCVGAPALGCNTGCDATCANDVFVSATFTADPTALQSITICLNGACESAPVDDGTASFPGNSVSFGASLAPLSDLCCGSVGIKLEVHATAYGTLHDGDTWSVVVAGGDGAKYLNATRSVAYGDVYGCDGVCHEASFTID